MSAAPPKVAVPSGRCSTKIPASSRGAMPRCTPKSATPNQPTLTMSPPGYAPVPYIAVRAAAGGGRYIEEEVLGPPKYFEEAPLRELRAKPRDLRAIEVEGRPMEPLLQNGDQVLVDTRKISIVEPGLFVLFERGRRAGADNRSGGLVREAAVIGARYLAGTAT